MDSDRQFGLFLIWRLDAAQFHGGRCFSSLRPSFLCNIGGYPIVATAGGLQSQGAKGAAVVWLLQALGNAGSGVLRLSRRVKKMAYNRPHPIVHIWFVPHMAP
jgi:expansin (peptidoglycan-binding protein)